MLGHKLVTKQTGPQGVPVSKASPPAHACAYTGSYALNAQVMIAESLNFTKETYFAILLDRAANGAVMVASPQGGMDIETVAEKTPELIFKVCATAVCVRVPVRVPVPVHNAYRSLHFQTTVVDCEIFCIYFLCTVKKQCSGIVHSIPHSYTHVHTTRPPTHYHTPHTQHTPNHTHTTSHTTNTSTRIKKIRSVVLALLFECENYHFHPKKMYNL